MRWRDLETKRKVGKAKDRRDEDLLKSVNDWLYFPEAEQYQKDIEEELPFIFIFGAPRSGSTLLSQVLCSSLDVGYITNIAARFWRVPVTGIRISKMILGDTIDLSFYSEHGATCAPEGIHEFGYFWRRWLLGDTVENVIAGESMNDLIDWGSLKTTLLNIQVALGKGWCCKNAFGVYHMKKLTALLKRVLWVYIDRDPIDTAISIYEARKKFYEDPKYWWSHPPPEFKKLHKVEDVKVQVVGQVYYLRKFFERQIAAIEDRVLKVTYKELCRDPVGVSNTVAERAKIKILRSERLNFKFSEADEETRREYREILDAYKSGRYSSA